MDLLLCCLFRIRRAGYPIRHAFQEFVNRYYMLKKGLKVSDTGNVIEKCKSILLSTLGEGLWQIGKTKVFLKVSEQIRMIALCMELAGSSFHCLSSNSNHVVF